MPHMGGDPTLARELKFGWEMSDEIINLEFGKPCQFESLFKPVYSATIFVRDKLGSLGSVLQQISERKVSGFPARKVPSNHAGTE